MRREFGGVTRMSERAMSSVVDFRHLASRHLVNCEGERSTRPRRIRSISEDVGVLNCGYLTWFSGGTVRNAASIPGVQVSLVLAGGFV
jgi:hypothetical protein